MTANSSLRMDFHLRQALTYRQTQVLGRFILIHRHLMLVNAFDNASGNYALQDVGLDGMTSSSEREYFSDWLGDLEGSGVLSPEAYSCDSK